MSALSAPHQAIVREPYSGRVALAERAAGRDRLVELAGIDALGNGALWTAAYVQAHVQDDVFGWSFRAQSEGGASSESAELVGDIAFRPEPPRGSLALRRALLVQDGTFDSDYLDLPIAPGHEEAVLESLLDGLAGRRGLGAVVLAGIPCDSPRLALLRTLLERRGWPAREHAVPCAAAELPATFEEYLGGLKKRMRTKVRSALRQAESLGAVLSWTRSPGNIEADLEGLYRLHAMRWEERGESGSFADPGRRAFYAALTPALLEAGSLRLAQLTIDGRPVAYQYGALVAGTYSQLQEGFDTEFSKERVGTALRALCIKSFIEEEGLARYDFLAGLTKHKIDWGAQERPCTTLAFALPRLRARLAFAAANLRDRLRARGD